MSMNVFNSSGTAFLGPQPFAFNRSAMLAGSAASFVTTGVTGGSSEEAYLPADLDGSTLPPAGAPETFVEWPNAGAYRIYHFHVDFATPANSTFTPFASPAAAGFTQLCPATRACVPEPNGVEPRRDRRPPDVPRRLPQLRRPRVARDELHRQLRQCRGNSLARASQRHRRAGDRLPAEHLPARLDLALDGQRGDGRRGRPRARLQRVERGDRAAAALRGPARERPAQPARAGRGDAVRRRREPDRDQQPLGRLQRPDRRPERRLHFLVHERVLPRGLVVVQLADEDRELRVPRLLIAAAASASATSASATSASAASASATSATAAASATTAASATAGGEPDHAHQPELLAVLGRHGADARLGHVHGPERADLEGDAGRLLLLGGPRAGRPAPTRP